MKLFALAVAVLAALCPLRPAAAGDSDCCFANGTPGCENTFCQQAVCARDPFCCDSQWDLNCAREAEAACGLLCGPGARPCPGAGGDCCAAHDAPGCDVTECCEAVCAGDPYCCAGAWDVLCAADARAQCAACPGGDACPGAGDCCVDHGGPGCDDRGCCDSICAADPFCCEVTWDATCAVEAAAACGLCGVECPSPGDCCAAGAQPGCDDGPCCEAVCAIDPVCCDAMWDALCADQASIVCKACGGGGGGDCCAPNGTPGCDDPECQAAICAVDPFCCETEWDIICVDQAEVVCRVCGGCPDDCNGDLDGSGAIDVDDLVLLILAWGTDGSKGGDTNCDDIVDVEDLLNLILEWGAC